MPRWLKPQGPLSEPFRRSPGAMLTFLILLPMIAAIMTVVVALTGNSWLQVFLLATVTILVAWQSVIYAPRAWRAHRR
jgi:hypothetical protein